MKGLILKKDNLVPLLRKIRKGGKLVAPVQNRHGDTLFEVIDDLDRQQLDLEHQAQSSLKPFFFPQNDPLATYNCAEDYSFEPVVSAEPTVYFGLRSCDLTAVLYMDVIFSQNGADTLYFARRKEAILISLGCNQPFAHCFCNNTGSGPFLEYGFDLQFTDLGDSFYVEADRARGEELLERWSYFFTPADEDDRKKQYQAVLEARSNFRRTVHVDPAVKRLAADPDLQPVWRELSDRCQDCGGCAYICPTCTCFTIVDQPLADTHGIRLRQWDSCTFSGFTRMAGGHNPVNHAEQAIRRRFLHKLKIDVEKHGRPSCVGCGRCVDICFGGVDMIRFIAMVNDLKLPAEEK